MFTLIFLSLLSIFITKKIVAISSPGAVSSFSPGAQYIVLTFNTPDLRITSSILDVLKAKKARGTFFINGASTSVGDYQQLVQRMNLEGHDIALYGSTASQISFTRIPREKMANHIAHASEALHRISGRAPKYIRPPLGQTNAHINENIRLNTTMMVALWSIDAADNEPSSTPDSILRAVTASCSPGDIVLMHCTRDIVTVALSNVIDELYKQGYEMVTLSQISSYPDDSPHR